MRTVFVENLENKQRIYDSLLLKPAHLGIFSSDLAVKIIGELAKQPLCAMDIAKRLRENEQKIYYHLRKMRGAGIVKLNGIEHRYGMTAKMLQLVSPVIATKLYDGGYKEESSKKVMKNESFLNFMHPIIREGKLNGKVVIGDSYSHGRFDMPATEGPHVFDLAVLMGNYIDNLAFPLYELDTEVNEKDLKNNLLLFGNPRTNVIIDKINTIDSRFFDDEGRLLAAGKKFYDDPRIGIIVKETNPLNKNKKIFIIGGVRTRGMQAAIIAITQHGNAIMANREKNDNFVCLVEGFDKDGDKKIDSVKILE